MSDLPECGIWILCWIFVCCFKHTDGHFDILNYVKKKFNISILLYIFNTHREKKKHRRESRFLDVSHLK